MAFELNKERTIGVLIWWIESTDGSIDYGEERAVQEVLDELDYSIKDYHQETVLHIGALGTDELEDLIQNAIEWGSNNFDEHTKKVTLALLRVIADHDGDGEMSDDQHSKLNKIKRAFGLKG
ncbi:MAG TPA: hypothetical protein VF181_09675 [Balneolaceae bacterium]